MDFDGIESLKKIIEEKDREICQLKQDLATLSAAAADTRSFYEGIISLMPGHVYWLDKNNVYLGCNDLHAQIAQLKSREEMVGKTNFDLPWKEQAVEINQLNNLVIETGQTHSAIDYAVSSSGMSIFLTNKTPLRDKYNNIIGVLGLSIEITEQKKLEAALRRAKENAEIANQEKTDFIANISHDIRMPLTGIIDMSKLLEECEKKEEVKNYAHWIYLCSKQLLKLLNGLFDLVAINHVNETDVFIQPYDLRKNIEEINYLLYPSIKIKHIDLKISIDEKVPDILLTDGIKLNKIILNLLSKAISYNENGTLEIKVHCISDDGIYAQLQFSILEANSLAPPNLHTELKAQPAEVSALLNNNANQDIDLSIAQKYAGVLGGEITQSSNPEANGSIFTFILSLKIGTKN